LVELVILALLAVVGLAVAAVVGFVFFLLKMIFWVVFLPIRLLLKLLWLPLSFAFGAVGMTLGLAVLPILLLVSGALVVFAVVATLVSLLIPAIPFVLLGLLIWALVKKTPVPAI
jgi:hypothetical protein